MRWTSFFVDFGFRFSWAFWPLRPLCHYNRSIFLRKVSFPKSIIYSIDITTAQIFDIFFEIILKSHSETNSCHCWNLKNSNDSAATAVEKNALGNTLILLILPVFFLAVLGGRRQTPWFGRPTTHQLLLAVAL